MTAEQQAALIVAASARATIRAMGMQAENKQREHAGHAMAYTEDAFVRVIEEEGLLPNNIVQWFNQVMV